MKKIALNNSDFALVDDQDFDELSKYRWHRSSSGYAVRGEYLGKIDGKYRTRTISMHRVIAGTPQGMDTDHINGNRLDNRRENLRIATRSQNIMNSKREGKPKGISRFHDRWMARIMVDGKSTFLGYFDTPELASAAYQEAAKKLHKEFARW